MLDRAMARPGAQGRPARPNSERSRRRGGASANLERFAHRAREPGGFAGVFETERRRAAGLHGRDEGSRLVKEGLAKAFEEVGLAGGRALAAALKRIGRRGIAAPSASVPFSPTIVIDAS